MNIYEAWSMWSEKEKMILLYTWMDSAGDG